MVVVVVDVLVVLLVVVVVGGGKYTHVNPDQTKLIPYSGCFFLNSLPSSPK